MVSLLLMQQAGLVQRSQDALIGQPTLIVAPITTRSNDATLHRSLLDTMPLLEKATGHSRELLPASIDCRQRGVHGLRQSPVQGLHKNREQGLHLCRCLRNRGAKALQPISHLGRRKESVDVVGDSHNSDGCISTLFGVSAAHLGRKLPTKGIVSQALA
jgi:hypothetical protein